MKTKTMLQISSYILPLSLIPFLANFLISFSCFLTNHTIEQLVKEINLPFVFWCSIVGFICVFFISIANHRVVDYADDIDEIEKLKKDLIEETKKMEKVRDQYTQKLSERFGGWHSLPTLEHETLTLKINLI
jgi:uncharacterized membrane protein (DUF106 family)